MSDVNTKQRSIQNEYTIRSDVYEALEGYCESLVRTIRIVLQPCETGFTTTDDRVSICLLHRSPTDDEVAKLVQHRYVLIDMTANGVNTRGVLSWNTGVYQSNNWRINFHDFKPLTNFTVGSLYRTIYDKGLHRYEFARDGSGSRYWAKHVMQHMYSEGWVSRLDSDRVNSLLKWFFLKAGMPREMEYIHGRFLSDQEWKEECTQSVGVTGENEQENEETAGNA